MLQIIYSLSSIDLPAYFEDNLSSIMSLFRKYLLFETSLEELVGDADEETPGLLHQVQAVVCQNLNLFIGNVSFQPTSHW